MRSGTPFGKAACPPRGVRRIALAEALAVETLAELGPLPDGRAKVVGAGFLLSLERLVRHGMASCEDGVYAVTERGLRAAEAFRERLPHPD